jgi:mRNA interferase MazF
LKQGEIWFAELSPVVGSEQAGRRPVVIISGNLMNEHLPVAIVIPLTTKIKNYKGNPVLEPGKKTGLKQRSEMLVFHVRSLSRERLVQRVGEIPREDLVTVIKTLNDLLTY